MSGKGKGKAVDCYHEDEESGREHGRRNRRREEMTERGKEKVLGYGGKQAPGQFYGGDFGYGGQQARGQFYGGELEYGGQQAPGQFYGGQHGGEHRYGGQQAPVEMEEKEEEEEDDYYWEDGIAYPFVGPKDPKYPNRKHWITERELAAYRKDIEKSEGYDLNTSSNYVAQGGIGPVVPNVDCPQGVLDHMAQLAPEEYNTDQGTRLEYHGFKKANKGICIPGLKFYMTFDVWDRDDHASPVKTFQAQVISLFGGRGFSVEQIRPKPTAA